MRKINGQSGNPIKAAMEARERAWTFATKVGVSYEMYDGRIFSGFNVQPYDNKGYHAEELGLINALLKGYRGSDFKKLHVIFQSAQLDNTEIYPACPSCWSVLNSFADRKMEISVSSPEGKKIYTTTLGEIKPPAPALVFPSDHLKSVLNQRNTTPRSEATSKIIIDKDYSWNGNSLEPVKQCAMDHMQYAVVFGHDSPLLTSAAFGMNDGTVIGGFDVQNIYNKGYRAEETAILSALTKGNFNEDFKVMVGVVPEFVDKSKIGGFLYMQWGTWRLLGEFGNPDTRLVFINPKGNTLQSLKFSEVGTLINPKNLEDAGKLKQQLGLRQNEKALIESTRE